MKSGEPIIALIAAVAENGVIGKDGGLPWRLPADLKRFKELTLGKPLLMGRKTFESIGRPLPGRVNIVLSRDPRFRPEGVTVAGDIDTALAAARRAAQELGAAEIMVIGGAHLYEQAIGMAERIYLTRVSAKVDGDARFPDYDPGDWVEVAREDRAADEKNALPCEFHVLERKGARPLPGRS